MLPLFIIVLIISLSAIGQTMFSNSSTTAEHPCGKHAARVDTHKA